MSIFGAMFSGVSGLSAQSQALGAIADNITNQNTVGYKATEVRFQTLVTAQASQNNYSPGGVQQRPLIMIQYSIRPNVGSFLASDLISFGRVTCNSH